MSLEHAESFIALCRSNSDILPDADLSKLTLRTLAERGARHGLIFNAAELAAVLKSVTPVEQSDDLLAHVVGGRQIDFANAPLSSSVVGFLKPSTAINKTRLHRWQMLTRGTDR